VKRPSGSAHPFLITGSSLLTMDLLCVRKTFPRIKVFAPYNFQIFQIYEENENSRCFKQFKVMCSCQLRNIVEEFFPGVFN
jgi:hypothetical protein